MKYTYDTATGDVTIEIPSEWSEVLVRLDSSEQWNIRKPHRKGRKHVRQILSLDAISFEGVSFSSDADTAGEAERAVLSDAAHELIAELPQQERRVMELLYDKGLSVTEAARELGVAHPAVVQARERALKKILRQI